MVNTVVNLISSVLSSVFGWFTSLFQTLGFLDILFGVILITCAYRFLLMPLFSGGMGSDKAKKSEDGEG